MKKVIKKLYFVWEADSNDDKDGGYYSQFDSLEDAVSHGGDGVEVFTADILYLGKYMRKAEIVKIARGKKSLKKKKIPG